MAGWLAGWLAVMYDASWLAPLLPPHHCAHVDLAVCVCTTLHHFPTLLGGGLVLSMTWQHQAISANKSVPGMEYLQKRFLGNGGLRMAWLLDQE